MEPSLPSSTARSASDGQRADAKPQRGPLWLSAPFFQALFLCLLALFSVVAQLRGGTTALDPILAVGIGLLLGFLLYRQRLFILTALVLPPGIVNQLFDKKVISFLDIEPAHLLALAVGLLAIAWVARSRLGWVQPGPSSPGIVVAVLGLLLLAAYTSGTDAKLIFSFWLPAAVFGALGLWYLARLLVEKSG